MNTETQLPSAADDAAPSPTPPSAPALWTRRVRSGLQRLRQTDWRLWVILLLAFISVPVWRAVSSHAKSVAPPPPPPATVPVVAVARVTRADLFTESKIPGEFRAYEEVDLHAKVSGFVKNIQVDFGDRVKAGQLLATLEVPELVDGLHNARATLQRAEADYTNAHLIFTRLQAVDKAHPNLVAQQELDTADAKARTTQAAIAAAQAEVERYQTMLDYTRITAPFDGVITRRYVDHGTLVQAGTTSDTQSLPIVRISDNYRLRLDFPVSVDDVKDIHVGDSVGVVVQSLGGKTFTGTITRSMDRIDDQVRKMTTEIEVPNPTLALVPGMYAKVILKLQRRPNALAVPVEAVATQGQSSVWVVNSQHEIEERPVTLGLETPTQYEVLDGVKEGELVLVAGHSQVHPGEKVEAKVVGSLAQQ
jgi:RND family efflux transporter MFP subunit